MHKEVTRSKVDCLFRDRLLIYALCFKRIVLLMLYPWYGERKQASKPAWALFFFGLYPERTTIGTVLKLFFAKHKYFYPNMQS